MRRQRNVHGNDTYFIAVIIGGGPGGDESTTAEKTSVRTTQEHLDIVA